MNSILNITWLQQACLSALLIPFTSYLCPLLAFPGSNLPRSHRQNANLPTTTQRRLLASFPAERGDSSRASRHQPTTIGCQSRSLLPSTSATNFSLQLGTIDLRRLTRLRDSKGGVILSEQFNNSPIKQKSELQTRFLLRPALGF